jgi:hypothetical protein
MKKIILIASVFLMSASAFGQDSFDSACKEKQNLIIERNKLHSEFIQERNALAKARQQSPLDTDKIKNLSIKLHDKQEDYLNAVVKTDDLTQDCKNEAAIKSVIDRNT